MLKHSIPDNDDDVQAKEVEEWEDDEFEVSFGRVIKESEISRIIQDH